MSSNAQEQHGDDHPIVGHLVPMSILVWTTIALLFLTVVTVAVRYVDVGEFNIVIAIGIAVLKATLVALFFMHLKWDWKFKTISLTLISTVLFFIGMMWLTVGSEVKTYESNSGKPGRTDNTWKHGEHAIGIDKPAETEPPKE